MVEDYGRGGYCMNNEFSKKILMVEYVRKYVPFYMRIYETFPKRLHEKVFEKLPIIDKKQMITEAGACLSLEYTGAYLKNELIHVHTSGTSGLFSEVIWHPKEMNRSLLGLWLLRKKYYGVSPYQKMCYYYWGQDNELFFKNKNSMGIARSSLYDGRGTEAYFLICKYNPEWMILQPSVALVLCEYAEKYGKPPALRYIEFTGEYLENAVRRRVEKIFDCYTSNQYGTKEVNSIAYECPCGKLHIMKDNVYVEIHKEGDIRNICVTTLQNHVMPMIRYKLDDVGNLYRNYHCKCGMVGDVLELESGRSNDMVICEDGSQKHPYMLMNIFHNINREMQGMIFQYQVIQKHIKKFIVRLVIDDEGLRDYIKNRIMKYFFVVLAVPVEVNFEFYAKYIPDINNSKLVVFRNEIKLQ